MQLFEHIKEMWGLSIQKLGKRLKISVGTLNSYNYFQRELPLWRLIQIVYETGISWEKVGALLEADYTKSKIRKLLNNDAPKQFQSIMEDFKNDTNKDSADNDDDGSDEPRG